MSGGHSAASRVCSSATRGCYARMGIPPGSMRPEACGPVTPPPPNPGSDRGAGDSWVNSAQLLSQAASVGLPLGFTFMARRPLPLRRFAGGRSNSRWSHRRMVSRPILMPINPRPMASVSAESPDSASRSNSSRCGSNWAVARLRGCRAWAIAWASVVGRAVTSEEWMGSDMVLDEEWYAWRSGDARGAPEAQSKRQGLDVGVLTYFFVLLLLGEAGYFFGSFIGWFIGLVNCLVFVSGVFVELVSLSRCFHRVVGHFSCRFVLGSLDPSLVDGGGGC